MLIVRHPSSPCASVPRIRATDPDAEPFTARPLTGQGVALREKSWSAAFQRQRDPDAAGRPRPRAPSAVPAAA